MRWWARLMCVMFDHQQWRVYSDGRMIQRFVYGMRKGKPAPVGFTCWRCERAISFPED